MFQGFSGLYFFHLSNIAGLPFSSRISSVKFPSTRIDRRHRRKKKRKEKENFFLKQELRDELWKQRNRADNKEIFILQNFPTNTTVFNFAFISFLLFLPQTKERQKISIEIANCSHRNQFVSVTVLPA